jgi:hypothetical protein
MRGRVLRRRGVGVVERGRAAAENADPLPRECGIVDRFAGMRVEWPGQGIGDHRRDVPFATTLDASRQHDLQCEKRCLADDIKAV